METRLKIVFMGSPEFSVPSLEILYESEHDIVGVITSPDRKAGRGLKLRTSPVKEFALSKDLPLLQPTNLKNEVFQEELASLKADLFVVVAFRMLPEAVWSMPALGTINLHASLLPQYRGAAPINWVIINGEKSTGLTTFFIEKQIDTGDLLHQEHMSIGLSESAGELHDRMKSKGAELVLRTVNDISSGRQSGLPQEWTGQLKKAPKIHKEDCEIDWTMSAFEVYNLIRGLSPYPGAWTRLGEKNFKIFRSSLSEVSSIQLGPGEVTCEQGRLYVGTSDSILELLDVQVEGKKRMEVSDFLRGFDLSGLTVLK